MKLGYCKPLQLAVKLFSAIRDSLYKRKTDRFQPNGIYSDPKNYKQILKMVKEDFVRADVYTDLL